MDQTNTRNYKGPGGDEDEQFKLTFEILFELFHHDLHSLPHLLFPLFLFVFVDILLLIFKSEMNENKNKKREWRTLITIKMYINRKTVNFVIDSL